MLFQLTLLAFLCQIDAFVLVRAGVLAFLQLFKAACAPKLSKRGLIRLVLLLKTHFFLKRDFVQCNLLSALKLLNLRFS